MEQNTEDSITSASPAHSNEQLTVLYQDDYLVAVNKPSGLLVHRSPIDRHETRFALQTVRNQIGCRVYPVHRLDKPTSGILLFALSPETARPIVDSFTSGLVQKRYLAVVRGYAPDEGVIDYPLVEEQDKCDYPSSVEDKGAQSAITGFRRLAAVEFPTSVGRYSSSRYSLVSASPETGRRRQLRRHFKHIFHPIIGDTKYGEGRHNRFFRDEFGSHRLLLHAAELTVPHPVSGELLNIVAPLDEGMTALMGRFGWLDALPPAWL
jgi:tRNA pseudouridine65 synthase